MHDILKTSKARDIYISIWYITKSKTLHLRKGVLTNLTNVHTDIYLQIDSHPLKNTDKQPL